MLNHIKVDSFRTKHCVGDVKKLEDEKLGLGTRKQCWASNGLLVISMFAPWCHKVGVKLLASEGRWETNQGSGIVGYSLLANCTYQILGQKLSKNIFAVQKEDQCNNPFKSKVC